jgi:hypothetical protein
MKKILSFILMIAMLGSLSMPVGVFADDFFVEEDYEEPFEEYYEEPFEEYYEEPIYDTWTEDIFFEEQSESAADYDEGFNEVDYLDEGFADDENLEEFVSDQDSIEIISEPDFFVNDEDFFEAGESSFKITQDLEDLIVEVGQPGQMTIVAPGTTSYKWQYRTSETGSWIDFTNNSGTVSFTMAARFDGRQYRCFVSDGTTTLESKTITLMLPGDFIFSTSETGDYVILVKYTGTDTNVIVPALYNNLPVKAIGNAAFIGNTRINTVSLPNSIEVIGAQAFKGCSNLSQMTTHD